MKIKKNELSELNCFVFRQPHCLVIHRGDVGKYVKALESDLRNLVEPFTAKNLKILKRNNIKDFIVNGAVLGVTNMMVLTSSDASVQLRMMRFSQGPTMTFKGTILRYDSIINNIIHFSKTIFSCSSRGQLPEASSCHR